MNDQHYFFIKGVVTRNGHTIDAVYGTEEEIDIPELYHTLSQLKINISKIREININELIHFTDHLITTDLKALKNF